MGLLVHTAGFVDPGFEGTLTLEISNQAEIPIVLYPDMYICQIAVE
jgi:dCTP deaminase